MVVDPLLCKLATIVLPATFVPLTRGQNRNSTVLADDDVICAVNEMRYKPPSEKTILVGFVPLFVMPDASEGVSNSIAYAVFAAAAVIDAS